ncbi:MAG: c-type cytochrome [Omnitrophica WOR_2 bacterium]
MIHSKPGLLIFTTTLLILLSAFSAPASLSSASPVQATATPVPGVKNKLDETDPFKDKIQRREEKLPNEDATSPTWGRLVAPKVSASSSQVEKGHFVYYQVCMACHGDRGQGLTDEWRAVFGPKDMNCWQSECHGNNHPPQGFRLVQKVPAIFGPGTLTRFQNAQDLHAYLIKTMPWWKPGGLTADEFWQVTAYIVDHLGALPEGVELNEGNASIFLLRPSKPLPGDTRPTVVFFASILGLAAIVYAISQKLR